MSRSYGLLGHAIQYSLSPLVHQAYFNHYGIDATYDLYDTEGQGPHYINQLLASGINGFNVTVPFKETITDHMAHLSEGAAFLGSVNTVVKEGNKWHGFNTDGEGFVLGLSLRGLSLKDKSCLVIGVGGAAKGMLHALIAHGVKRIYITNRTPQKLTSLLDRLKEKSLPVEVLPYYGQEPLSVDLVIQTTPLGGPHFPDDLAFDLSPMTCDHVFDIHYHPQETLFLAQAKKRGINCYDGLDMLVCQAVLAEQLWQKGPQPLDLEWIKELIGYVKASIAPGGLSND